jgi:uncharacterized protein YukE
MPTPTPSHTHTTAHHLYVAPRLATPFSRWFSRVLSAIRELEDKLTKVEAETRDLAARLAEATASAAAATGGSSDELDMLKDKLAKKQKAFLALQANFEKAYVPPHHHHTHTHTHTHHIATATSASTATATTTTPPPPSPPPHRFHNTQVV